MELKTRHEIEKMKIAGSILAKILSELSQSCVPGKTTSSIDALAFKLCEKYSAKPTFFGYRDYPGAICISVNDEVIHGLPGKRVLKEGDLIGLDMGVTYEGWIADSALTVIIPPFSKKMEKLRDTTQKALYAGIKAAKPGSKLFDISSAIFKIIKENGFSSVREFVGHGVGRNLHEEPSVPNFVPENNSGFRNIKILPGMTIAIEPMVNEGSHNVKVSGDNWTVTTADGKLSAHFEHTIAILKNEIHVLTKREDEKIDEIIKF
ncbi:type I methionyl aminopeptidase [candidate division WOR-3 bacterium]|nr:type I methionyl aminopeptidase [candidate division WOR-3 bacterium]